jgi:hypothetical protein
MKNDFIPLFHRSTLKIALRIYHMNRYAWQVNLLNLAMVQVPN